jgi:hypothetical protein
MSDEKKVKPKTKVDVEVKTIAEEDKPRIKPPVKR